MAQCLAWPATGGAGTADSGRPRSNLGVLLVAESLDHRAPVRAKEMAQYMVDHRDLFKGIESYHWDVIDIVRKSPALTIDDSRNTFYAELDKAIQNAEKNPDGVYLAFERFNSSGKGDHEQTALFLAPYFDHPDPVVQFGVHRTMGDVAVLRRE